MRLWKKECFRPIEKSVRVNAKDSNINKGRAIGFWFKVFCVNCPLNGIWSLALKTGHVPNDLLLVVMLSQWSPKVTFGQNIISEMAQVFYGLRKNCLAGWLGEAREQKLDMSLTIFYQNNLDLKKVSQLFYFTTTSLLSTLLI